MYFENCRTAEELKSLYYSLAKKYHSDINGGNDEEMKVINAEYDLSHARLKDVHVSAKGETYHKASTETPAEFREIIARFIRHRDLEVELCGCWVWIHGNTKAYKEELKAAGCCYAPKKQCWSWHHEEEGSKHYRGKATMSEIRLKYGSQTFRDSDDDKLN